jgi:hypothetical protein
VKTCKNDDSGFLSSIYSIIAEINELSKNSISFQWVPSHCEILGNDEADRLAKAIHTVIDQPIIDIPLPQSYMKKCLLESVIKKYDTYWHTISHTTHLGNIKDKFETWHRFTLHDRHSDVVITRLRLGHSRLRGHLYRIGLVDDPNCAQCSIVETPEHLLLNCPSYAAARVDLLNSLSFLNMNAISLRSLLGGGGYSPSENHFILCSVCSFLKKIGKFMDI